MAEDGYATPKMAAGTAGEAAQPAGDKSIPIPEMPTPDDVMPQAQPTAPPAFEAPQGQYADDGTDESSNLTPDEEKFLLSPSDRPYELGTTGLSGGDAYLPDGISLWLDQLNNLASQPGSDESVTRARDALVRAILSRG